MWVGEAVVRRDGAGGEAVDGGLELAELADAAVELGVADLLLLEKAIDASVGLDPLDEGL